MVVLKKSVFFLSGYFKCFSDKRNGSLASIKMVQ